MVAKPRKEQMRPRLDSFILEIKYTSGHLYYDRCGQTLLDIEREREGWLAGQADPNTGTADRPEKAFRVNFNANRFDFSAQEGEKTDLEEIAEEASSVWKIVQANLGLKEFSRLGCRYFYLRATTSIEEAEGMLEGASLNITFPERFEESGYEPITRQSVIILKKEETYYRVQLGSVTRLRAMDPTQLLPDDPKALSKKQREYRIAKLRLYKEYSRAPMYAVSFDIDCHQYSPESILLEKYILEQAEVVKDQFLPILEEL